MSSDRERYLRALAIAGLLPEFTWGTRALDADNVAALLSAGDSLDQRHPWGVTLRRAASRRAGAGASVVASYNTAFPWGANDGPQWQGRGGNLATGVAMTVRLGPVRATLAPTLWLAQNTPFPLMATFGRTPYANALFPNGIDLPQRHGGTSVAHLAPGESSVRLEARGVVIGLSTAALGWGTGETFPALLGANAGGFPHLFVGTRARGVRLGGAGIFGVRYVLGTLAQSAWSPVTGSTIARDSLETGTRRIGVGLVATWIPGFLPGVEVGAGRFFHSPWRARDRWSVWRKPFEGVLKSERRPGEPELGVADPFGDVDNQLASLFVRWRFPRRGVELDAEVFRDDHNWDRRDLAQEPEQAGAIAASARVVTHRTSRHLGLLTLEYFDGDVRAVAQQRPNGFLYSHTPIRQGHTLRGQLMGAPMGAGGITAQRLAWERFGARGSVRAALQRWQPRSRPSSDPQLLFPPAGTADSRAHDWVLDASAGVTRLEGQRALSVDGGLAYAGVWQFGASRANAYVRASWTGF
ncbi:MAG: hypothetical protein MUE41_01155 [Gemmatimonadaceae bacterium]|nr:hypothetical protein [Gemmatimonadaceae bacterium]